MMRFALAVATAMLLLSTGWIVAPTAALAACSAGQQAGESSSCVGTGTLDYTEETDENGQTTRSYPGGSEPTEGSPD